MPDEMRRRGNPLQTSAGSPAKDKEIARRATMVERAGAHDVGGRERPATSRACPSAATSRYRAEPDRAPVLGLGVASEDIVHPGCDLAGGGSRRTPEQPARKAQLVGSGPRHRSVRLRESGWPGAQIAKDQVAPLAPNSAPPPHVNESRSSPRNSSAHAVLTISDARKRGPVDAYLGRTSCERLDRERTRRPIPPNASQYSNRSKLTTHLHCRPFRALRNYEPEFEMVHKPLQPHSDKVHPR